MRTEQEMMDLIHNTAKQDERIRAVTMNGSRVNNEITKDCFQDYDIVYFVTDFDFFANNHSWIDRFGERIILEMPAYKDIDPSEYNGQFNYQMLFKDGNRLDLTFAKLEKVEQIVENDPVGCVLLDKDGILQDAKFSGTQIYWVTAPTKREFENSCNSFWWILQNIAKGQKRKELAYAMQMFSYARNDLNKVVSWHIGMNHDFMVSPGKMGKYYERYLDKSLWDKYAKSFPSGDYEAVWKSLFISCELYRQLGKELAKHFSYDYPSAEDEAMTAYLHMVHQMDYHCDEH